MADITNEAANVLETRLEELREEQGRIQRALKHLIDSPAPRRSPSRRRSPAGRSNAAKSKAPARKQRAKRAPRGQRREQLLAAIKAQPGRTATELATALGIRADQVRSLAHKAGDDKLITKRGKKYFPSG